MATEDRPPGWYDDPREPGARRYWTGEEWTTPLTTPQTPDPRPRRRVWPSAFWIVAGAIGLWFAETYKPSAANQLGLNGNSFYLKSGTDHLIVIVSIVVLALGVIRLLVVLNSR